MITSQLCMNEISVCSFTSLDRSDLSISRKLSGQTVQLLREKFFGVQMNFSPSMTHNIIKRIERNQCMFQGWKQPLNACDLQSIRQNCKKNNKKTNVIPWRVHPELRKKCWKFTVFINASEQQKVANVLLRCCPKWAFGKWLKIMRFPSSQGEKILTRLQCSPSNICGSQNTWNWISHTEKVHRHVHTDNAFFTTRGC